MKLFLTCIFWYWPLFSSGPCCSASVSKRMISRDTQLIMRWGDSFTQNQYLEQIELCFQNNWISWILLNSTNYKVISVQLFSIKYIVISKYGFNTSVKISEYWWHPFVGVKKKHEQGKTFVQRCKRRRQ